jgi:uncharacterized Zn-binding protein involved in type VI secretion
MGKSLLTNPDESRQKDAMTTRHHITLGALTTSGRKVITATSFRSIHGVSVACEDDSVTCPKRRSVGVIKPGGPRLSETCNGKEVALNNDLCICKCKPSPRLIAIQSVAMQTVDGDWHLEQATASASQAEKLNTADSTATDPDRIPILLLDPETNEPFKHRPYRLELKDQVIEGTTDQNGATRPLTEAERDAVISWHVGTANAAA